MSRRATRNFTFLALFMACVSAVGCSSGTPSNFNSVSVSTTTPVIVQGGTASISGTVANDTSGDGVSWTLMSGGGSLANATKTSVTYQAPSPVAAETTATIKATSVSFPSSSNTITITIEPPVQITTASLPAANQGTNYSAQATAIGGVPPFTWSVSAGSLTSQLTLGASNTRTVAITGIPLTQTTDSFTLQIRDSLGNLFQQPLSISIGAPLPLQVTTTSLPVGQGGQAYPNTRLQATGGVPPITWALTSLPSTFPPGLALATDGTISGTPTQAGTYTFSVLATDSEAPAQTAPATLSITIDNLSLLSGNYAFQFNGFDSSGNAVSVAGSFTADGAGNLSAGVQDVVSMTAAPVNQTFTGTYTLDQYGQGVLTLSSLTGSPAYAFTLNETGVHAHLIRFDASGIRGSGDIVQRTVTTCGSSTISGNYAFGLSGQQALTSSSTAGPLAIVGSFVASPPSTSGVSGSIAQGEQDANTPAKVTTQDKLLAGTYTTTSETTRCTMTLSSSLPTMHFSVYPVNAYAAFLIETDAISSTSPTLLSGSMQQQTGAPFSTASGSTFSSGTTTVAAFTGSYYDGTAFVPDVAILSVTGTGSTSYSIAATENQAGNVVSTPSTGATFIQADQFGRVASASTTPYDPVFYMISQNTAYAIGETRANGQPDPFFGIFEPQSGAPFTAATIATATLYVGGTTAPAGPSVPDIAVVANIENNDATTGLLAGEESISASSGNASAQIIEGDYTVPSTSSASGAGTIAFIHPATTPQTTASFVIISPTEVLAITTTSGDTNPVLLHFQQ